jgi:hypothetical protein
MDEDVTSKAGKDSSSGALFQFVPPIRPLDRDANRAEP